MTLYTFASGPIKPNDSSRKISHRYIYIYIQNPVQLEYTLLVKEAHLIHNNVRKTVGHAHSSVCEPEHNQKTIKIV